MPTQLIAGLRYLLLLMPLWVSVAQAQAPPPDAYWYDAMRQVQAKFTGRRGTFAQFGDSITVTLAFWTPLLYAHKNASPAMEDAYKTVKATMQPECWRDWKGPDYGSESGQTSTWALAHVDAWLKQLNPEVALIMFGTNDLHQMEADTYRANIRAVITKCLDNGTVVILSTIPPRHGDDAKAATFAAVARDLAQELKVPLVDYQAEILKRRPRDWDGATDAWKAYQGYDVPTLIARDGVHPSNPAKYADDYSEEGLSHHGFGLRNYLTLLQYAYVLKVLNAPAPPIAAPAVAEPRKAGTISQLRAQPWLPRVPPLSPPAGEVIKVSTVDQLFAAAGRVRPGGTIMVADGIYKMSRHLDIKTDGVTVRGASGQRDMVVLDGDDTLGEMLTLTACTGVIIADLTVQNVRWNGIKLNSETNVQRAIIYNCVLHNIWQRAIKGVRVPEPDRERIRPTGCRIVGCLFTNDRPKQFADDPADTAENFGGNYIGGIDTMFARGWTISDNVFIGIQGRTREARGAIFMWQSAEDCTIERNVIIDCDSGICLGNSLLGDNKVHCSRFIVRNNFITRAPEQGILADYTHDCKIMHNTVCDPANRLGRLIRLVHDNDGLLVANNLLCGPPLRNESPSKITFSHNLEKDISTALADAATGNLHLTARAVDAIDHAAPFPDVSEDINRRPRGAPPDIGAAEYTPVP